MSDRFIPVETAFGTIYIDSQWECRILDYDEAYEAGFVTADLLSNPYPDGSVEARRFVDGWVDGRKWDK